jgi:hypothetical protein
MAAQFDVLGHDTLSSVLEICPRGAGLATWFHAVPFQISENVPYLEKPTATQSDGFGHETASSPL